MFAAFLKGSELLGWIINDGKSWKKILSWLDFQNYSPLLHNSRRLCATLRSYLKKELSQWLNLWFSPKETSQESFSICQKRLENHLNYIWVPRWVCSWIWHWTSLYKTLKPLKISVSYFKTIKLNFAVNKLRKTTQVN